MAKKVKSKIDSTAKEKSVIVFYEDGSVKVSNATAPDMTFVADGAGFNLFQEMKEEHDEIANRREAWRTIGRVVGFTGKD